MDPSNKLIEQIKRSAGGRISDEDLERSLAILEAENPIGALMSTLAAREFRETLRMLAWMTVAAANAFRVRRVLAKRAVRIVAPHVLVDVLGSGGAFAETCAARAEEAPTEEEWGAWLLLGQMRLREVRGAAKAAPALRRRLQDVRRQKKHPINPQLHGQLRELGLV